MDGVNSPEFKRNITSIAKELVLMERSAIDDEVLFGTSPVLYREKRRLPLSKEVVEEGNETV